MSNKAALKTKGVSSDEISFLIATLDEMFQMFQVSNTYFYGEEQDRKVLTRINKIRAKNKQRNVIIKHDKRDN